MIINSSNNKIPLKYNVDSVLNDNKTYTFGCGDIRKDLLEINDTICPSCGDKIISLSKYNRLYAEAANLANAEDLYNFLNTNKDLMPVTHRKKLIYGVKYIRDNFANPPIDYTIKQMRKHVVNRMNSSALELQEKLLSAAQIPDLPEKNILSFENTAQKLESHINNDDFKKLKYKYSYYTKEINALLDLDLPDEFDYLVKDIQNYCYEKMEKLFISRYLFDYSDSVQTVADLVMYKMLNVRRPYVVNISSRYDDDASKIPVCSRCVLNIHPPYGFSPNVKETQKGHFKKFIEQVSLGIAAGANEVFYKYPQHLIGFISKATKGAIALTKKDLPLELRNYIFNKNKVHFPVTEFENVPCACCGIETITHDTKNKIQAEIYNSKTPYDLIKVVDDNRSHVNAKYRKITNSVLNSDFDMHKNSWSLMAHHIDKTLQKDLNYNIQTTIKRLNDILRYTSSYSDFNKLQKFITDFNKVLKSKNLVSEDILAVTENTNFENQHTKSTVYKITHSDTLWDSINRMILYKFSFNERVPAETRVKRLFSNVLNLSVATVDHLDAKVLGGSDDLDNLVVMCKECNNKKADKKLNVWMKYRPDMKDNLVKYFKFVNNLSKEDKIHGMDTYEKMVMNKINKEIEV